MTCRSTVFSLFLRGLLPLALATALPAQEAPRTSLFAGGPTPFGVIVPIGEQWSVRAGVGVSWNESRIPTTSRRSTTYATSLGALRALGRAGDARPYVALDVRRNASNSTGLTLESYEAALVLGARARVAGRLGLLAEAGPSFGYAEFISPITFGGLSTYINRSLALTTRLGATWTLGRAAPPRE